jgi:hypothetical protein
VAEDADRPARASPSAPQLPSPRAADGASRATLVTAKLDEEFARVALVPALVGEDAREQSSIGLGAAALEVSLVVLELAPPAPLAQMNERDELPFAEELVQ